jgi:peptidoglycan/xylan/chitin deacetylase (PgdA/CDA1 family)
MKAAPPRRARPTALVRGSAALHLAAIPAIPAIAAAPRFWPWVAGALVADHLALLAGGLMPRSTLLGPNVVRDRAAAAAGRVALTFDDGPDPAVTPEVLRILESRGVTATFFCVGECLLEHRDLAAEIARRGHAIENHTHTHPDGFFFYLPGGLEREVARCQNAIEEITGRPGRFFRAPAGIRSPLLAGTLAARGLELASWTRRGYDAIARDPAPVLGRLVRGLAAGDVLVLHDGARHDYWGGRRVVVEVLPRLLDAIEAAGLRAGPLSVSP